MSDVQTDVLWKSQEKSELYRPDRRNFTLYPENVVSDLHCRRTKSDTSDVCETRIVFRNSVVSMRIVTLPSRIDTLHTYFWRAHNA